MLPPSPVLVAAKRWLEVLSADGHVPRAQALLTNHAKYSDLTPTQYATAFTWLSDSGVLEYVGPPIPPGEHVLTTIFERAAPSWVKDADRLVHSPDELPIDIAAVGDALGLSQERVYRQLMSSWGKVDTAARERVGAAGEAALVALLQGLSGVEVDHVASRSDGFGYDMAVTVGEGVKLHLEVKSTNRSNRFTAYLSRHEFETSIRDDEWVMVLVRLDAELEIAGLGCVSTDWIVANVPRDVGSQGSWSSAKLEIPNGVVCGGIPLLPDDIAGLLPHW